MNRPCASSPVTTFVAARSTSSSPSQPLPCVLDLDPADRRAAARAFHQAMLADLARSLAPSPRPTRA